MAPDAAERRPGGGGVPDDALGGGITSRIPGGAVTAGDAEDEGAAVYEWVSVIRRARLGPTVTAVALMIATYADPDGTHVYPGIARLAVQAELDYRTVRRAVAALRAAGLIEMVRRGARRSGRSDEYRLILAVDLLERCEVPTPAAERLAIEGVTAAARRRADAALPAAPVDICSTGHPQPVEPVDNPDPGPSPPSVYRSPGPCRSGSTGQRLPVLQDTGAPPPSIGPVPVDHPPADDAARRTPRTGSRPAGGQNADDDHASRQAEEAERQRQLEALKIWTREHQAVIVNSLGMRRERALIAPGIGLCFGTADDFRAMAAELRAAS
jgi:Helix-turn-helix domain